MSASTFIFQIKRTLPIGLQLNPNSNYTYLTIKYNRNNANLVFILLGKQPNTTIHADPYLKYEIITWDKAQNTIVSNYSTTNLNCSISCQILATEYLFLLQNNHRIQVYNLISSTKIANLLVSKEKKLTQMIKFDTTIRRKGQIINNYFLFVSSTFLEIHEFKRDVHKIKNYTLPNTTSFNNLSVVLDSKMYENRIYFMVRNFINLDIYIYQINCQEQFIITNNTNTTSHIIELFRFSNQQSSQVVRFQRGLDITTKKEVIWAYNQNQAYKCGQPPCINKNYQIYENIKFKSIVANKSKLIFYGNGNNMELKAFKPSITDERLNFFVFNNTKKIVLADISSNRMIAKFAQSTFVTEFEMVENCQARFAENVSGFCQCSKQFYFNNDLNLCSPNTTLSMNSEITPAYIFVLAGIVFCNIFGNLVILLACIILIVVKIKNSVKQRKSWTYNAADHIIFQ